MTTRKPRVFIASSAESLNVADAINVNLDHSAEVSIWKNSFDISTSTIDSLIDRANSVDFAIFVFTPDDISIIRESDNIVVRDNVLYELGLFTGTLGKERCFIVKPRGVNLHFPTDLLGLTPADYEGNRTDGDLISAINSPCVSMKKVIDKLGLISNDLQILKINKSTTKINFKINDNDNILLLNLLSLNSRNPNGTAIWQISNNLSKLPIGTLDLSAIKLERLGLIKKSIEADQNEEFYVFAITEQGVNYILENEDTILSSGNKFESQQSNIQAFDKDIPF